MESDGRIRSKDIGTGEVNSRALDNIRSSNFDGSHTDPENDPGSQGWQILKSGFMVINQAVVRGTISAARIIGAIISGGEVNITEGGKLTVGGDAETGVAPLVTLDEDGLRVGTDVVVDDTGLWIDGGQARALDIATTESVANSAGSLTTTATVLNTVTFSVPSWALNAYVLATGEIQLNTSGTARILSSNININTATAPSGFRQSTVPASSIGAHSRTEAWTITPGATITVRQWGKIDAGSEASHNENLSAAAWFTR